jgi:hypothetical protein
MAKSGSVELPAEKAEHGTPMRSKTATALQSGAAANGRHLLVLGCSARKQPTPGLLPAIERYDGPLYRVLRKALRERCAPEPLDILVVSARYGLLRASDPIEAYDQVMTKRLSESPLFREEIARHLAAALAGRAYCRAHISLGGLYLAALGGADLVTPLARHVSLASGGIGQRQAQLRSWLLGSGDL